MRKHKEISHVRRSSPHLDDGYRRCGADLFGLETSEKAAAERRTFNLTHLNDLYTTTRKYVPINAMGLAAAGIEDRFVLFDLRISAKSAGLDTAIVQMGLTNVIDVGNAIQLGPTGQVKPHDFGGRIWISQTDTIGYRLIKRTVLESPRPSRWLRHSRTTTGTRPLHLPEWSAGIIAL